MNQKVIFLLISLIIAQGCDDDCGECFTPPAPFEFELVDKSTGENLFTNGTFSANEIGIINLDNQSNVVFTFIDENDHNTILINTIGWETETANYSIRVSSENIFDLFVNAERIKGECCNFTEYNEIRIENSEFELIQPSGMYKIFVE